MLYEREAGGFVNKTSKYFPKGLPPWPQDNPGLIQQAWHHTAYIIVLSLHVCVHEYKFAP